MKQNQLDNLNAELLQAIEQYTNGMITIVEFTGFTTNLRRRMGDDVELAGLIDPNTGMQFPTVKETDDFMAQFTVLEENRSNGLPRDKMLSIIKSTYPRIANELSVSDTTECLAKESYRLADLLMSNGYRVSLAACGAGEEVIHGRGVESDLYISENGKKLGWLLSEVKNKTNVTATTQLHVFLKAQGTMK